MDYGPEQINHLIVNLVSNAIKFTPSGGDVVVRILQYEDKLVIEVEDNGIGIAEEDLPHIFDRFYQADSSSTGSVAGTGIGLAYVQELVRLMGGDISVKSALGKGSTFILSLPVRKEASRIEQTLPEEMTPSLIPEIPDASTSIDQETEPAAGLNLPHLLIIEDNTDLVTYLKSTLKHRFKIDIAYNGKIGIEKALENIPDIIISDVMMPENDGFGFVTY